MEEEEEPPCREVDDYEMMLDVAKYVAQAAGLQDRGTGSGALQQSLKLRMIQAREKRAARLSELQPTHRHVCDMVGYYFGMDGQDVCEGVADSDLHIEYMNKFLSPSNFNALMFYYQMGPAYEIETGRYTPLAAIPTAEVRRIMVTTGTDLPIREYAVACYKFTDKEINLKNIPDVVYFLKFDMSAVNNNTVAMVSDVLSNLIRQSLREFRDWGDLLKTELGRRGKQDFSGEFETFCTFLESTKADLEKVVLFELDLKLHDTFLDTETKRREAVGNEDLVEKVEGIVRMWSKQIEKALVEYQQIRKECEFVGPEVEIEYWRQQLCRFSSVSEFYERLEQKNIIDFMEKCKSRLMPMWKRLANNVYLTKNECSDNLRYLYAIQKYWQFLYRAEPPDFAIHVPTLLKAIRMTFISSRYYNTSYNITAILVKVSNQMINKCRSYINCYMNETIWTQKKRDVLAKIKICLDLYMKYYQCYKHILNEMKEAGEPPFDCSEMYIFGKFQTFQKRLEEIADVLETTLLYSILQSSTIEGIDEFATKFDTYFKDMAAGKYDALNHRLPYFHDDYMKFRQYVVDTEWELEEFVGQSLAKMPDVDNMLRLLKRFEKLNLDCLHLDERYLETMVAYHAELDELRDKYNEDRANPLLPRNMTPVAGRIMWIRYYYSRIEEPMEIFKTKPRVMPHRSIQKCIQLFNALAMVFLHYEKVYHEAWCAFAAQVRSCLNAPVLVKSEKGNRYLVNFDPYIFEVIRETEYIYKLDLAVPDVGQILVACKEKIMNSYEVMCALVRRNNNIRQSIPTLFLPLFRQHLLKIDDVFRPAFSVITWTSTIIPEFSEEVSKVLDTVEIFTKAACDMKEARIDEPLDNLQYYVLIDLPPEPVKPEEILAKNVAHMKAVSKEIAAKSEIIERATIGLINLLLSGIEVPTSGKNKYDWMNLEAAMNPSASGGRLSGVEDAAFREIDRNIPIDLSSLHQDCLELFGFFTIKVIESLVKSTRVSLEKLKNRIAARDEFERPNKPIMITNMELQIPINVINPDLNYLQSIFKQLVDAVIDTTKYIGVWGQLGSLLIAEEIEEDEELLKIPEHLRPVPLYLPKELNFNKVVSEHKDVTRLSLSLQGNIYMLKPDITELLKSYLRYEYLWDENRAKKLEAFCDTNPLTVEIGEKFQEFENKSLEIKRLPAYNDIMSIRIITEKFKLALLVESNAWKYILGNLLGDKYKVQLDELVEFIKNKERVLSKPIKVLDDCRIAMDCLDVIRANFIEMDMALVRMEEAYAIFERFKIDVPPEDIERVESLRVNFNNMIEHSKQVQEEICLAYTPLLDELMSGVEKFRLDCEEFDRDFDINGPMVPGLSAKEASDRVIIFQDRFDALWNRFETYGSGERLFGLEVQDYPILHKRKKEFNLLSKLYGLYLQVVTSIDGYFGILWSEVDIESIINELAEFQIRCRKLPKAMKDWPAFLDLKQKIDDFSETCPLLELMANKAMKDRHWDRLTNLTGYSFDIESPSFTLQNIMEAPLLQYKEEVEDICVSAVKEKDIESKLRQVIADWSVVELTFSPFKTRGELLLKAADAGEIVALLEDSQMIMNSLASNRYNAPFKKDITLWSTRLANTSEVIERWLVTQNLWMYLEAVFVGGDISRQLPAEAKKFANIDKTWVRIMMRAHEKTNAVECCAGDDVMITTLPYLFEQLESCQKSLTGYLEIKRLLFPRFFFVSDPVLLEILGQSSDPTSIQKHLSSLFDAVERVTFDEKNPDTITEMWSAVGECIPLEYNVRCTGGVEIWLNNLLKATTDTVKLVIAAHAQLMNDADYDFMTVFLNVCGQAGLVGIQIKWTKDAECAIRRSKTDRFIMRITNQYFLDLLNSLIELTSRDLTKMIRTHYETMITIHVHQRDIFDDIVRLRVKNYLDFEWQKQARFYYFEDTDGTDVRITDVIFEYQDEYLGITERLVITPLTDRCYITLAQAIWINMGGAPAGPAGTGKTETTKDMGRTLGKYVIVFNCSDQMDFKGLGRIFKGLAQSGSWGCFDEFNRIDLPVLSVAAQQIFILLQARKERKAYFIFSDGDNVKMNIEFGIFLTMNPGYAGRQELPENLKIMFRSVAMMVPDRQIIIRVKLASCGYKSNVYCAKKFFTLYALCEEQLSKQVHYDFGLRNILSCLRTLGAQKRMNPYDSEETTVMRVLRDMNLSKLIDEDEPLFLSLIEDMFPGIKLNVVSWKDLQRAVTNQSAAMGLINYPSWNLKVVQLYETSLVRHGLMIMGPTGAGKTKCCVCLCRSMTEMGNPHREMRMNPKAITAPQMFGRLDSATNDWTDGIFSTLWRRTLKVKKTENVWLVLDGPVDAIWIENLNSVLDDNKTLTLANGDRIVMAPNSKLVFEPDNVDNASPATVSRMGMVFMSSSVLPWPPILQAWLITRPPRQQEVLKVVFDKIYEDLNTLIQTKLKPKMFVREALYIRQCYDILMGILDAEEDRNWTAKQLERIFLFSLMWSLGSLLELEDRGKMEEYVVKHSSKLDWPKPLPEETIFEYRVNPENGQWAHWSKFVEDFHYPTDSVLEFTNILVPNVDNTRTAYLIDTIAKQNKAVLLIGEQGTAKTVMIKGYTSQFDPEFKLSKAFNFSSATTPNMVQRILESYVDKRVGTTYGPPAGKTLTVFIDDINMPVINAWGDQITNEIVRQCMEQGGFYSLDKPGDFSTIVDVLFLAAMIHPGGGRNDIPNRLKRQFCIFNCTLPSDSALDVIFSSIACGYFCIERFCEEIVEFIPRLIPLTRHIWQHTKIKMLPTPAKFHYVFNLRDISRIWQGILTVQNLECRTIASALKLWRHECLRVVSDRFTDQKDRDWFYAELNQQVKIELMDVYDQYYNFDTYWVDFLREPPEATGDEPDDFDFGAPKIYEELPSWEFLKYKLATFVEGYNDAVRGAPMELVFFHDALVNLMIVSRIIRSARGNALLVGVGGSGKQSLTRLSSFIANYKISQIQLTRTYNMSNLMEDMKYLYRVAGFEGSGISFLFTDNEIKDEAFLESINNILSSGEIANLFAKDELDEMMNELIPVMKKKDPKRIPTPDNLYDFFITRARANLHVVLCFSPVGQKFRNRALKFPGLISGCTIRWFYKWPRDALNQVSQYYLTEYQVVAVPQVKDELMLVFGEVHDFVNDICTMYYDKFRRMTFVTPQTFISLLSAYKGLYLIKKDRIAVLDIRMRTGLTKLVEAQQNVDELKKDLVVAEAMAQVASEEAGKVLLEVLAAKEIATKIKGEATIVKEQAESLVLIINEDKKVAEGKLKAAKPALDAAEAALQTIKASDIATVRKLGKPPYLILLILDCVIIYFKKKLQPTKPDMEKAFFLASWDEALKVMADTNFLRNLQQYPKDTINAEQIDLLVPYFTHPLYTFETALKVCSNVAGLLSWTIAMASFYDVNVEVLPLKANLAKQAAKLQKAQNELKAALSLLAEKEAEVAACQEMYEVAMVKKQKVEEDAAKVKNKMDSATALITGLTGERIRWTDQLAQFKAETDRLVGDVVVMVSFLGYTGPFNQEFRALMIKNYFDFIIKRKIPITLSLNLIDSLTDKATIGEWNIDGLPTDELSTQNGIIVTSATRYPLLIDPQGQGKNWIKNKEKNNQLIVTTLTHKYFRNHLEDAVSLGYPLIIEDIGEELDPVLDKALEKNYIKVGSTFKVKLGDKEVDINFDFRVYMTTKLPNPNYTPEIFARTSVIDFTVTMKGLEDQLLGRVINTEKKELEQEKQALMRDVTFNTRRMKELEANLLYKLTTVQGSLLDDPTVIDVLNANKNTAAEIQVKLVVAAETEIKIDAAREEFRPVATRGSILYFLIVSMALVENMYQTSLLQFLERFDVSIARSTPSPITFKRINNIIDYLTLEVFSFISVGFYERHKYMFVLLMGLKIDLDRGFITHEEFQYLIKGGAALDLNACPPKPAKWITDLIWLNLNELINLRHYQNIVQQVSNNDKVWKAWFDKDAPEDSPLPEQYNNLDVFRKLLIVRAFCIDRTVMQSRKYLAFSLGPKFAEPVILNMHHLYNESRALTPLICFLSLGSDPTPYIEQLAKRLETRVKSISMGQGQEVHARKIMTEALADGFWALLQNCHLCLDYLEEILSQLYDFEKGIGDFHPDFRLWITAEPHPDFPISLLQLCIKYTNEAPSGIRAGLLRTYQSMNQDLLDYSDAWQYIPLIYGLSFLHSVVQERRKFGPLGWCIPYEFNSADWLSCCLFVQNHLDDIDPKKGVSWPTIRYMIGEVHYGGRVTDDYDKRLLNCFTKVWFSDTLFTDDFEFFRGFKVIKLKSVGDYLERIALLPPIDPPQVYGLHSNADITYSTNTTLEMFDSMLSIQPKESSGSGGESRESVVNRLSMDMLSKVPPNYDPYEVKERLRAMGHLNPLNIFLRQEIDRMQKVISIVRTTLKDLLLAIEGIIIMNEALRNALDSIYDAKVPESWKRPSWLATSLGFWFTEMLERNIQFSAWIYKGRPLTFWLTGFFNPQGFLTAMKQEVARAHKGWALDAVILTNEVTKHNKDEINTPPNEGVYIYGLFLDGAGWDKKNCRICESTNKVLYTLMPVIWVSALYNTTINCATKYVCPVYKKIFRTGLNYITALYLNTPVKPPEHWTLRGAALLCDIQ